MNLALLGPPGAGKGTQAIRIAKRFKIPHISTGDMFRRAVADQTEMGLAAKGYMNRGELVPDNIVIGIVRERLAEPDSLGGFLLDGFPRTVAQAEALAVALDESGRALEIVLNIQVGRAILIRRLTGRRTCRECGKVYHLSYDPPRSEAVCDLCEGELWQRDDDGEETVQHRLDVYDTQTMPLIDYYRLEGTLVGVDGEQEVESVFRDIEKTLSA